jgi:hypothetical protein
MARHGSIQHNQYAAIAGLLPASLGLSQPGGFRGVGIDRRCEHWNYTQSGDVADSIEPFSEEAKGASLNRISNELAIYQSRSLLAG